MNPYLANVRLLPATIEDYATIQNMARFYVYDRTSFMGWPCPSNGLFECIDFKHYFENPDEKAFLIKVLDEIAGFVLLDKIQLLEPVDWNMGEFFVLAKFQGKEVAHTVVQKIFTQYPGRWSVAVMPENIKALKFWRKAISQFTRGMYTSVFKKTHELRGTEPPDFDETHIGMQILTFDIRPDEHYSESS